jgi:MscS family membrane protein
MSHWLRDYLPAVLFEVGPKGLTWFQWLAFPMLALLVLAAGRLLGGFTRALLGRISRRTRRDWDDRLLARTGGAIDMIWAIALFRLFLPWLELGTEAREFIHTLLVALAVVTTFWGIWRAVDVFAELILVQPWAADNPSARSLVMVGGNFLHIAVFIGGVVSTIAAFGYPVATMLAGLGIGGLALAFGAQKTIEHLFGSVALAADQPIRVGDFVKVEDFVGTVEQIGTRSTRFRTLDRTVITIPNGRLADQRLETFAARDRIRLSTTIGVTYGTTEAQMHRIITGMEEVLRSHPKIWRDVVVVRFAGFGASSLDIEIMAWFETNDYDVFRDCRQQVLLGFMKVVEGAGASFAFPTRTVHLVQPEQAATKEDR